MERVCQNIYHAPKQARNKTGRAYTELFRTGTCMTYLAVCFYIKGMDPGTDLRGTGLLGLMQILYFVMDSRTLPLARDVFKLSQHESQACPSLFNSDSGLVFIYLLNFRER